MDRSERPHTSGSEARRTIELLTAIYKSAFTERPVRQGEIMEGDPFYQKISGDR
jgi:hypothetical protein